MHAVASPYRDRSHFDGQNVLETGGSAPYQMKDGWMNRLVSMLPAPRADANAIAFAPTVPLALRGRADVTSYAPSALPQAPDDLLVRVSQLYAGDAQLHALWSAAMEARGLAADAGARQDPASLGKLAASFLGTPDGPRIAMIETGGWDTHSAQNPRLAAQLKALDTMIAALRDGLGEHWANTTVLVATEFGRTAAANGTGGTDHGTASAAMLFGGAVRGGRVLADWPGLAQCGAVSGARSEADDRARFGHRERGRGDVRHRSRSREPRAVSASGCERIAAALAARVTCVAGDRCSVAGQQHRGMRRPRLLGDVLRRQPAIVAQVAVRAAFEQQRDGLRLVVARGPHQRRQMVVIGRVHVDARVEQTAAPRPYALAPPHTRSPSCRRGRWRSRRRDARAAARRFPRCRRTRRPSAA